MGNQSAARLHGDDYQHLYSWLEILDLLDPNTVIGHVWVENPHAAAADDLTIHPKDPTVHPTKYIQIKAHMDLSETYTMAKLATPPRPGSKSLLQSLWESWQKLKTVQLGELEIWLVSDWLADGDSLGRFIRNRQFTDDFLAKSSNTRTNVGKECAEWKTHLYVEDHQEFTDFCCNLHFRLGYQKEHLWKLVQAEMRSHGLKWENKHIRNGIGIIRDWIQEGRRAEIDAARLLRKIEEDNLWANASILNHQILLIERQFQLETSTALQNIQREIPGIGYIPRQEIQNIEAQLKKQKPVILVGDAGTGKSGIAATLAGSALDGGKIVLLLDARLVSKITQRSELKNHLDLDCDIQTAVEEAANYKGCRIIIDQLDNVIGSRTADLMSSIALDYRSIPGVEIVVITRRGEDYLEAPELKKLIEAGFVEQTSNLLDASTAQDALKRLGISEPSEKLIEITRTLLYLEIISLIKREDPDSTNYADLTSKIALWGKYLEVVTAREAVGHGSDHARQIVAEAKKLACAGLRKGESEITLDDRIGPLQRRLKDTILTRLSGRIYRFRHEELQYFLYAKDATETGKMPVDVAREIGHSANNVLPWMRRLYFDQSHESDYARDLYIRFWEETFNVR